MRPLMAANPVLAKLDGFGPLPEADRALLRAITVEPRRVAVGLVSEGGYALPITRIDLADTSGPTSVSVNRSLRDTRRDGLIDLGKRRLRILDLPRLRALAEFDLAYLQRTGQDTA
jgi:CRP-like cAMP-binding protein